MEAFVVLVAAALIGIDAIAVGPGGVLAPAVGLVLPTLDGCAKTGRMNRLSIPGAYRGGDKRAEGQGPAAVTSEAGILTHRRSRVSAAGPSVTHVLDGIRTESFGRRPIAWRPSRS
jgi:hypothetical protein